MAADRRWLALLLLAGCGVRYVQAPATAIARAGAEVQFGDKLCWVEPKWLGANQSCSGVAPAAPGLPRCRMSSARQQEGFWAGPAGWRSTFVLDVALTADERKRNAQACCYTCSERQVWYR